MTSVVELSYASPVFISLSALVNIILAALILLRLIFYQRHIRNILGADYESPYTSVMTMFVESSALIVIANAVYTAMQFASEVTQFAWIPYDLFPHICVGGFEFDDC